MLYPQMIKMKKLSFKKIAWGTIYKNPGLTHGTADKNQLFLNVKLHVSASPLGRQQYASQSEKGVLREYSHKEICIR